MALLSVMGLLAVLAPSTTSQATITADAFESDDGNLAAPGTPIDWNDFEPTRTGTSPNYVYTPVTPTGFGPLTTVGDRRGNPDDIFSGGVKQDKTCPGTKEGSLGGGDSKFDVARLYLTYAKVGTDDFLYLAWVRQPQNSTTASSHIAFEFNSGTISCTNGNALGSPLLQRTEGDKLVVYDFEGGEADATLKLATWILDNDDFPCEVASNSAPCWALETTFTAADWDAKVNTASVDSVLDAIPDPDETLGIVEFGEAGINLTTAGVNVCSFAGHVTGVSRSSGNSGTAQMKDKVGPAVFNLPRCVAETSISSVQTLHDEATIIGFNSQGAGSTASSAAATLTFTLYGDTDRNCNGLVDTTETGTPPNVTGTSVAPVYTRTFTGVTSATFSTATSGTGSAGYKAVAAGTYNWLVTYSGDTGNSPATSVCGDEKAVVTYVSPSPTGSAST